MAWFQRLYVAWVASCALIGCGLFSGESKAGGSEEAPHEEDEAHGAPGKVAVEMPWETTKVRDDATAPVLRVVVLQDGKRPVPVPYVYGYPLYPEGAANRGLLKLRQDNYLGATREQREDEQGVIHVRELLPQLGCSIEGVLESEALFAPVELRCELPPPRDLGGSKRPVFGELRAGASPREVLAQEVVAKAFYGDWHMQSEGLAKGKGEGFFNTDHGQLAFGFERGKLVSVAYYFDPPVKGWRDPSLWAQP
jgi:hypothetical protein